ncbi:transglutaminase-like domain-containing protein [Rarobacter incanus]|uniref:Transglutaminase superfamily protein n=1 Tax=Rarobacter incanus TaxID=153494 RepID=A0A542SQD7_9MICO|nr:transglutaminase-like domain-containing protein [Rarobacter incanus]TQK76823.1 transglutaminase superfamily protein [Rarobacter incanus]
MTGRTALMLVARTLALWAAFAAGLAGLTAVLVPGEWQRSTMIALAIAATPALATRLIFLVPRAASHRVAAAVTPLGVLAVSVIALPLTLFGAASGPQARNSSPGLVTLLRAIASPLTDRVTATIDIITPVGTQIAASTRPMEVTEALAAALVVGVVLLYLIVEPLVIGAGYSWATAVVLAALWAAPLSFITNLPPIAWVVGGASLVFLLATGTGAPQTGPRRLVVAAVVSCLLMGAGGGGAIALTSGKDPRYIPGTGSGGGEGKFSLASTVDIGTSLTERSDAVAYTYRDTSKLPRTQTDAQAAAAKDIANSPMRLFTASTFDGLRWTASSADTAALGPNVIGTDEDPADLTALIERSITLVNLVPDAIPLPTGPVSLVGQAGTQDEGSGAVSLSDPNVTTYSVIAYVSDATAKSLRAASDSRSRGAVDSAYLTVPSLPHLAQINALAQSITAGARTSYDKLVALQEYFRSPGNFTYSTKLDPIQDADPVWSFLESGKGYCVQFATAMTVMARGLGIPVRFAQGFLPGTTNAQGNIEVTGKRAHAWPEAYFDGIGWVRFEPTPSTQTNQAPSWTVTDQSATPTPSATPTTPTPTASTSPSPSAPTPTSSASPAVPTGSMGGRGGLRGLPALLTAVGAALVLALVAWGMLAWRRARAAALRHDIEKQWARVTRRARRAGFTSLPHTTPRQLAASISAAHRERETTAGGIEQDDLDSALSQLLAELELTRYADQTSRIRETSGDPHYDRRARNLATILAALTDIRANRRTTRREHR